MAKTFCKVFQSRRGSTWAIVHVFLVFLIFLRVTFKEETGFIPESNGTAMKAAILVSLALSSLSCMFLLYVFSQE